MENELTTWHIKEIIEVEINISRMSCCQYFDT